MCFCSLYLPRSPWRDKSDTESDKPYTIRFRVPDGETSITDHVQGDITWENLKK